MNTLSDIKFFNPFPEMCIILITCIFMKILAVNEKMELSVNGSAEFVREYSSVKELKSYLKNRPWISFCTLMSWRLYRIPSDGSKLPMRYGIRTMYDFVEYYKIYPGRDRICNR